MQRQRFKDPGWAGRKGHHSIHLPQRKLLLRSLRLPLHYLQHPRSLLRPSFSSTLTKRDIRGGDVVGWDSRPITLTYSTATKSTLDLQTASTPPRPD